MNSPRATFKQIDLTRATKGVLAAGLEVGRVEIDHEGKIVIVVGKSEVNEVNDWDAK
jgi:hypothetical protein